MKYLIYLVYILIALILVTVAVANPEMVRVTLLPEWFPIWGGLGLTLPLFAHVYIALFVGIAMGLFFEYLREARYRKQARRAKKALKKTEAQLDKTKKKSGDHDDEVLAIIET